MPPRRLEPLTDSVELHVDGEPVKAARGEPVAVALVASGRLVLGRSVKYHRPRGPVCFRGRCEGCLMRVDGVPNVTTCRVPARSGLRIETQNTLGSAEADLLAATDWFFPGGMDHHHMFTRFRPVNELMQKVARRVAGVGTLPDAVAAPMPPRERDVDILVVGAGPAGIAAANAAAAKGARVLLLDEEAVPGGGARLRGEPVPPIGPPVARAFGTSLLGLYDEVGAGFSGGRREEAHEVRWYLAGDGDGVIRIRARQLVLATGATPATLALPGADRPGIFSAEGAWALLAHGVRPGEAVSVVHAPESEGAARKLAARLHQVDARPRLVREASAEGFTGAPALRSIRHSGQSERCDAAVLMGPASARYALAGQAGAMVRFAGGGFVVDADDDGRTAHPTTFAVGSATGRHGAAASSQAARAGGLAAEARA